MGSVFFGLTNLPQFSGQLNDSVSDVQRKLAMSMYQTCELIMTDSKENYCPVDIGTLRDSGHVDPPELQGDNITVWMGYGGPADHYALIQHERLDYHHTVGQAKYLEIPTLNAQKGLETRLARVFDAS